MSSDLEPQQCLRALVAGSARISRAGPRFGGRLLFRSSELESPGAQEMLRDWVREGDRFTVCWCDEALLFQCRRRPIPDFPVPDVGADPYQRLRLQRLLSLPKADSTAPGLPTQWNNRLPTQWNTRLPAQWNTRLPAQRIGEAERPLWELLEWYWYLTPRSCSRFARQLGKDFQDYYRNTPLLRTSSLAPLQRELFLLLDSIFAKLQ